MKQRRARPAAVAAAFLVAAASCGGSPQVSPPVPPEEEAPPTSVELVPPAPPVSSTGPASTSTTASSGTGVPYGELPASTVPSVETTAPGVVGSTSTTLPSVSSTTLHAFSGDGVSSWSTEELAGSFEARVDSFRFLDRPEYDVSTPLGAFCWAWWEVARAFAFEAILGGKPPHDEPPFDEEGDGGTTFKILREELVHRARRGEDEAVRVLLNAADVRIPGDGYSLASAVEAVDVPGVRAVALSAEEIELRSVAEALFAWVDEYKRDPVSDTSVLEEKLIRSVSPARFCEYTPPPGLQAGETPEEVVEAMRALTLEEVDALTLEQIRYMNIDAAFNNGYLLGDFPLDLQFAWSEKSLMESTEYIKAMCCYGMTTEEVVEELTVSEDPDGDYGEGFPSFLETLEGYSRNENDPSSPVGAFCWAYMETYRSFLLHWFGNRFETFADLYRGELIARAEMGDAAAAEAVRGMPELPPTEYPFADALAAVDDPRVRGLAFSAADPVLLEVVGVFYGLVDKYRQDETLSLYTFTAELWSYVSPGEYQQSGSEEPDNENMQALFQARQSLLEECKFPGEDWWS